MELLVDKVKKVVKFARVEGEDSEVSFEEGKEKEKKGRCESWKLADVRSY